MDPPCIHQHRTSPFTRSSCLLHLASSIFLHLASSIFLHLAFFISHPPPLPDPNAPTLPPRDTSSVTISHGKGSGDSPTPPAVEQLERQPRGGYGRVFPLALSYLISSVIFPSFLVLDICNTWVLALENWPSGMRNKRAKSMLTPFLQLSQIRPANPTPAVSTRSPPFNPKIRWATKKELELLLHFIYSRFLQPARWLSKKSHPQLFSLWKLSYPRFCHLLNYSIRSHSPFRARKDIILIG